MTRLSPIALMSLLAMLAGCQTLKDVSGLGTDTPASAAATESVPTPPAPQSQGTNATASRFKGVTGDQLVHVWGEPSLKRNELGAQLWQYGGSKGGCSILFYLYPAEQGRLKIAHAEASPGGAQDEAVASCAKINGKPLLVPEL